MIELVALRGTTLIGIDEAGKLYHGIRKTIKLDAVELRTELSPDGETLTRTEWASSVQIGHGTLNRTSCLATRAAIHTAAIRARHLAAGTNATDAEIQTEADALALADWEAEKKLTRHDATNRVKILPSGDAEDVPITKSWIEWTVAGGN